MNGAFILKPWHPGRHAQVVTGKRIGAARRRLPMVEVDAGLSSGPPQWQPEWPGGRPISQWSRLAAGRSDDLTAPS